MCITAMSLLFEKRLVVGIKPNDASMPPWSGLAMLTIAGSIYVSIGLEAPNIALVFANA